MAVTFSDVTGARGPGGVRRAGGGVVSRVWARVCPDGRAAAGPVAWGCGLWLVSRSGMSPRRGRAARGGRRRGVWGGGGAGAGVGLRGGGGCGWSAGPGCPLGGFGRRGVAGGEGQQAEAGLVGDHVAGFSGTGVFFGGAGGSAVDA